MAHQFWLVRCPVCELLETGAVPPGGVDYSPFVECIKCGAKCDASVGRFVLHPIRVKKEEEVDLLSVD